MALSSLNSLDAAGLRTQFESAEPFRYFVVERFLDPAFCDSLAAEFPSFDERQATNELGVSGGKAVRPDLAAIGPAYRRLDDLLRSSEFLSFLSAATGIPKLLYDPEYVGGGTHENRHGQELDTHVDFNYHPRTRLHRRLNLILFLNPEWSPEWGGLLELQRNPAGADNLVQTVEPLLNRCVLFETTENSWHGFRRIVLPEDKRHLSRRSIAVYFYTKERPREEAAPSHGTVYVQRPPPAFLQPGYTLQPEDVHELQIQFARRDTHIRYLYERELEFSRVAQSPAFRIARALTWPLRKLRDGMRGDGSSAK